MSSGWLECIIRWVARGWAVGSLLLLSAFIFGDGERSANGPTLAQWVALAFFPLGISVGMLIAFWKELWGGGITVLSLAGFYACMFAQSSRLNIGPWFVLFAMPGFLFLLAGLIRRQRISLDHPEEAGALHDGHAVG